MKKTWFVFAMLGLFAVAGWASASDGEIHAAPGVQAITGEVVDLACYLGHGESGPGHADCARKCIGSGLPVGIKTGDRLYVAIGAEHGTANATLAPWAAKQVTAEGKVSERDGIHLIAIQKVEAARS